MEKSQKHYAAQKKIQKCLYSVIIYIWNFRKDKPNSLWQKIDQLLKADGMGVIGRGHKGIFWSDENVHLDSGGEYTDV